MKGILKGISYLYLVLVVIMSVMMLTSPLYFLAEVKEIFSTGILKENTCLLIVWDTGLIVGISMIIPVVRNIYNSFPWLFSFIKIAFFDVVIMGITIQILISFGVSVLSIIGCIIEIFILRVAMSFYFDKVIVYEEIEKQIVKFGMFILAIGIIGICIYSNL